jgi:hypothetical protein
MVDTGSAVGGAVATGSGGTSVAVGAGVGVAVAVGASVAVGVLVGGTELLAEAPQPVSNPTKAMPVTTMPFMGLGVLRDLKAGARTGVWMAMVRALPETQFVDADPQHLGEPLRITGVGALLAFLPGNGGARRNSAPEGERLLGQEEPLSKLANSVPRQLYGSLPNMYLSVRRFM